MFFWAQFCVEACLTVKRYLWTLWGTDDSPLRLNLHFGTPWLCPEIYLWRGYWLFQPHHSLGAMIALEHSHSRSVNLWVSASNTKETRSDSWLVGKRNCSAISKTSSSIVERGATEPVPTVLRYSAKLLSSSFLVRMFSVRHNVWTLFQMYDAFREASTTWGRLPCRTTGSTVPVSSPQQTALWCHQTNENFFVCLEETCSGIQTGTCGPYLPHWWWASWQVEGA